MKIDNFLLALFQKISDWFQMWFGITNFFLARTFAFLSVISLLLQTFLGFRMKWIGIGMVAVFIFLSILFLFSSIFRIKETELSCKNNPVFTNRAAIEMKSMRINYLLINGIFALLILAHINYSDVISLVRLSIWLLIIVTMQCYFYFVACTPKPPSKSKVKKLAEKVSEMLLPAPRVSIA